MKDKVNIFKIELQKHNLKVTKSRLSVFTILNQNAQSFLTPDEIFDKIKNSKLQQCDRTSVYRVLASLESIGLVSVSHFQGEASKYQLHLHTVSCNHTHESHDHYFKCISCNLIEKIGDCLFDSKLKELTKLGYKSLSHHFEISGLCPNCN